MIKELITTDPQPEVRKNAENAADWIYKDQAAYLYRMATLMRERLIDPIARIDRNSMPDPIIGFNDLRNYNTLAAYRLIRNPQGLNYEITFNAAHFENGEWRFGRWALLETLAHELVHEWQQTVGKHPVQVGKVYHNREFVDKCEGIGLHPKLNEGYHLKLADGPFAILMKELGIEPPNLTEMPEIDWDWFKWLLDNLGKKPKGRSSLTKWSCGCQNVRVGTKEFKAHCDICGNEFKPVAQGMLGLKTSPDSR